MSKHNKPTIDAQLKPVSIEGEQTGPHATDSQRGETTGRVVSDENPLISGDVVAATVNGDAPFQPPQSPSDLAEMEDKVEDEPVEEEQDNTTDLAPHQRLDLRHFVELLNEYEERYTYKDVATAIDRAAHCKLHASIRLLLTFDEVVMKEAFSQLLIKLSTKHVFNAFGMPTLVKYTSDISVINSSAERVFISEFLSLASQFARSNDKVGFRKTVPLARIFESIGDERIRARLDTLFPR